MFCVMCRSENPETGRYCWKCGEELIGSSYGPSSVLPASKAPSISATQLCTLLKDRDESVREKAIEALGRIGDTRVVEQLVLLLDDPNTNIIFTAAKALEALSWKPESSYHKAMYAVSLAHSALTEVKVSIYRYEAETRGDDARHLGYSLYDQAADEGPAAIKPILRSIWFAYGIRHFREKNYAHEALEFKNAMRSTKSYHNGDRSKKARRGAAKLARLPFEHEIEPAIKALRKIRACPDITKEDSMFLETLPALEVRGVLHTEKYFPGADEYLDVDEFTTRTISL